MHSEPSDSDSDAGVANARNATGVADRGIASRSNDDAAPASESDVNPDTEDASVDLDLQQDGEVPSREDFSQVSFDELQKLQGKIGTRRFREMMSATASQTNRKRFKRENKNRPMEISSKRPARFLRQVIPVKKKIHRDPRFDDLSGTYNEAFFKNAYSFIGELKCKEKEKVQKQLKKEHDPAKKAKLSHLLLKMEEQEKREAEKDKRATRDRELKKEQIARVRGGKQPFFLKKSDKKVLELAEKYKKLKETGSLEKYMTKKRKKNASRDRKLLPTHVRELDT